MDLEQHTPVAEADFVFDSHAWWEHLDVSLIQVHLLNCTIIFIFQELEILDRT